MNRNQLNNASNEWAVQDPKRRAAFLVACEKDDNGDNILSMSVRGDYRLLIAGIVESMRQCPNLYNLLENALEIYQEESKLS